ncbi:hypothetical protein PAEPH01_2001 [Pancytospora epiphaga]|nr:hypothetical protein PAEPH01_2001 [Pancytospora epiphaga]
MVTLMNVHDELREFFQSYDQNNKTHVRLLEMLVEGTHTSTELAELEEVSGMNLSEVSKVMNDSMEKGAGAFDGSPGRLFNLSMNREDDGRDDVKRMNLGNDKQTELFDKCIIPGLGGDEDDKEIVYLKRNELVHAKQNEPDVVPILSHTDKKSINKQLLETVFYKSIFIPVKISETAESYIVREPAYLFLPLQCKLCGLRYMSTDTDEFGLHIDEHRRKARALEEKEVLRREFFTSKNDEVLVKLKLIIEGGAEIIPWTKECPNCVICGDVVKKVWRDDAEEWVLESGVKINENEFTHRKCVL